MNKKLRKFLEQNGLRAEASEKEAWDLYDELKAKGIELIGVDPGQRSDAGGQPGNGQPAAGDRGNQDGGGDGNGGEGSEPGNGQRTYSAVELQNIIDARTVQALANDASRRNEVQNMIDVAGVAGLDNGDFARSLINNPQVDSARASQLILTELQKRNRPIGTGAQVGIEAGEKTRSAALDGLLLRSGIKIEKPSPGASNFRGRSLLEVCRELLEINGVNCRSMSRMELAGRALASGSTSDLPYIFSSLVGRTLQNAYTEWPSTWRPFVAPVPAMDFRDIHAIKLSGAPDLKGLNENGEYQTASFSDAKESYRLITKGIKVPLTRQMIINDDLRALSRIPQLFGVAAKRMESDAVYSLLTANAAMSDGVALFHADHKNLAGTGTAISSTSLGVGRAAMRKQTGLKGERIDVIPAFLLTPVAKETDAEILIRSASLPTSSYSAGVVNPWAGKLEPISDPHLDDNSSTAWYLLGHPNQVALIEVAWLEGEEQPFVDQEIDFNSDAMIIKVRHDFAAGVADHVSGYKNPGA